MLKLLLQNKQCSSFLADIVEVSVTDWQEFVIFHRFLFLFFYDKNSGFCCSFFECKSKIHLRSEIFAYVLVMSVLWFLLFIS